jgi:hypothetical protein
VDALLPEALIATNAWLAAATALSGRTVVPLLFVTRATCAPRVRCGCGDGEAAVAIVVCFALLGASRICGWRDSGVVFLAARDDGPPHRWHDRRHGEPGWWSKPDTGGSVPDVT